MHPLMIYYGPSLYEYSAISPPTFHNEKSETISGSDKISAIYGTQVIPRCLHTSTFLRGYLTSRQDADRSIQPFSAIPLRPSPSVVSDVDVRNIRTLIFHYVL